MVMLMTVILGWVLALTGQNGAKTDNIVITVLSLNLDVNILYHHFQGKVN
jgi:hypothetical protein